MCNWSFEATGILEAKLFMGLMSTCSRVQRVDWQEKPQSDLREFYAQNTTSSSAHSLAKKMTTACYTESVKFQNHLNWARRAECSDCKEAAHWETGPAGERATWQEYGHWCCTSSAGHKHSAFKMTSHCLLWALYWKRPICSRQHY